MTDFRPLLGLLALGGIGFVAYHFVFTENLEGNHTFVIPPEDAALWAGIQDGDEIDLPENIKVNGDDFESGASGAPYIDSELNTYNQRAAQYTQEPIEFPYLYDTEDDYLDWGGNYDYWG